VGHLNLNRYHGKTAVQAVPDEAGSSQTKPRDRQDPNGRSPTLLAPVAEGSVEPILNAESVILVANAKGWAAVGAPEQSFLARNEFFIRRAFSLCGLVPVGAYMCVHLVTNSSLAGGAAPFQKAVYQIHSLGPVLPIVEWLFIFLPIIFHAVLGVVIIRGGMPNTTAYAYGSNVRYTLQRATGMIAFLFIFLHVFHLHGWLHFDWFLEGVAKPLGGAQFAPYSASSTLAAAFQKSWLIPVGYAIGLASCIFHLSNGIWSFGVRWGLWISPAAMRRAGRVCTAFGLALGAVSLGAVTAPLRLDPAKARIIEQEMYDARVASHEIEANEHKRAPGDDKTDSGKQTNAGQESAQTSPSDGTSK